MRAGEPIERHPKASREATSHPFLDGVREVTLLARAFETWLVQDYPFVDYLRDFQSRLLARSPRVAQAAIAGGLVDELAWFEKQAGLVGSEPGSAEEREEAEQTFLDVARLERSFWEMAYAGGGR